MGGRLALAEGRHPDVQQHVVERRGAVLEQHPGDVEAAAARRCRPTAPRRSRTTRRAAGAQVDRDEQQRRRARAPAARASGSRPRLRQRAGVVVRRWPSRGSRDRRPSASDRPARATGRGRRTAAGQRASPPSGGTVRTRRLPLTLDQPEAVVGGLVTSERRGHAPGPERDPGRQRSPGAHLDAVDAEP